MNGSHTRSHTNRRNRRHDRSIVSVSPIVGPVPSHTVAPRHGRRETVSRSGFAGRWARILRGRRFAGRVRRPHTRSHTSRLGPHTALLAACAALLLVPAPAAAFNPYEGLNPADSYRRLGAALPVARAAWPNSPCRDREQVAFVAPELSNGEIELQGEHGAGLAMMDGSCRVYISLEPLTGYQLCALLTHEFGHLAGREHSSDPRSVMFPTVGYYKPCAGQP